MHIICLKITRNEEKHLKIMYLNEECPDLYGTKSEYHKKEGHQKEFLRIPVPEGVDCEDIFSSIRIIIEEAGCQIDDANISKYIDVFYPF